MPKLKAHLAINLNLLKPQSNPEKLPVKLFRWLLATGRYLFVIVEAVVLIAFGARFKLDADLATKKEAIEEQIPYIESLKPYEILIRQTQLKLTAIQNVKTNDIDWSVVLKKISNQTPSGVKIISLNMKKVISSAEVNIAGQTQTNNDLTNLLTGLKEDSSFTSVNLSSAGMENGVIKFTIEASVKLAGGQTIYEK